MWARARAQPERRNTKTKKPRGPGEEVDDGPGDVEPPPQSANRCPGDGGAHRAHSWWRRVIHRPEAAGAVGARRPIPAIAARAFHEAPAKPGGGARRRVPRQTTALCRRREGPEDDPCRDALGRNVHSSRNPRLQAFCIRPSVGGPLADSVGHRRAAKVGARAMKREPKRIPGVGRLVPPPALVPCAVPRPARTINRGGTAMWAAGRCPTGQAKALPSSWYPG